MADGNKFLSSDTCSKFQTEHIDVNSIKLLNDQSCLIYDGCRIKWQQDLCSLEKFVDNVIGLSGNWKSPRGRTRRFLSNKFDLSLTWYPGKQNSLLFHGKDGEILKDFLVNVFDKIEIGQAQITASVNDLQTTDIEPDAFKDTGHVIGNKLHCENCEKLVIKLSEIEDKLSNLYDITHKIYNTLSNSTTAGAEFSKLGGSLDHDKAVNDHHKRGEFSHSEIYDLSTELEGVKLDVVINNSKLSNDILSNSKTNCENTQAINQLKEQWTDMQNEQQLISKEISKQNNIIQQLSSQLSVKSLGLKNLPSTQQRGKTTHSNKTQNNDYNDHNTSNRKLKEIRKLPSAQQSGKLFNSNKNFIEKYNTNNTKLKEITANINVDLTSENQSKSLRKKVPSQITIAQPKLLTNEKSLPKEAFESCEVIPTEEKKQSLNNRGIGVFGNLPLIDFSVPSSNRYRKKTVPISEQHQIPVRITTRAKPRYNAEGWQNNCMRHNTKGFWKRLYPRHPGK